MKPAQPTLGTLYLVPTPLDFGCLPEGAHPAPITECLPIETVAVAARLTHWISENAKSTRAFLKRVEAVNGLAAPLQAQAIVELP
ncbi:MAG: ribosomal RNA small subunit methyltransferase I, partial [Hydrogenophaga sp.]|nr:ribosomal RNA small subunit methyltransferase I [Hydrogenophaga sp.]